MAGGGLEMRACGGVLAAASLAFLLLAIFIPGLEWVGVDKLVLFSDEAADSSLEVYSSFHFGFLWARQQIETEIDAVVFQEEGYGWCAGTTPAMPPATQKALCHARRLMWACTTTYLLLGLATVLSCSCGPGAGPNSLPRQRRSLRFLAHALTVLAAAQLLAGVGLSYMWSGIKRGVEAYFTANYTETNTLVLRVGWAWYLAGLSGLATTALLLLNLHRSWLAERHRRRSAGARTKHPPPPPVIASPVGHNNNTDLDRYRMQSDGSLATVPLFASASRASSRGASPVRTAARGSSGAPAGHYGRPGSQVMGQQQQQQQERRYPQRHAPTDGQQRGFA